MLHPEEERGNEEWKGAQNSIRPKYITIVKANQRGNNRISGI